MEDQKLEKGFISRVTESRVEWVGQRVAERVSKQDCTCRQFEFPGYPLARQNQLTLRTGNQTATNESQEVEHKL